MTTFDREAFVAEVRLVGLGAALKQSPAFETVIKQHWRSRRRAEVRHFTVNELNHLLNKSMPLREPYKWAIYSGGVADRAARWGLHLKVYDPFHKYHRSIGRVALGPFLDVLGVED